MNLRRIPAIAAIAAAVLGGTTVLALGAGAAGLELPELPRVAIAGPADAAATAEADTPRTPEAAPASLRALTLPTADPQSPEYNPYTTPGDDEFVEMEERAEYLGTQTVIAQCMAEQGLEYRVVGWWTGQDAQPTGLDYETSIRWLDAYYGEQRQDWTIQDWRRQGCLGFGTHAAEVALAAGAPLTAEVPADDESLPTERQQWREFQGFIAECMADAGQEYLSYDYWNLTTPMGPDETFVRPGQPEGLTPDQQAAWALALDGNAGAGAAYRWEDAGCSGYATHMTGNDNMH